MTRFALYSNLGCSIQQKQFIALPSLFHIWGDYLLKWEFAKSLLVK